MNIFNILLLLETTAAGATSQITSDPGKTAAISSSTPTISQGTNVYAISYDNMLIFRIQSPKG